ncbi:arginine/serine-rich protein 1 isoform 1-T1 [Neosynchiropus ocellatus]
MAKEGGSHSAMARARKNDGISVIFDQISPASSHSQSRSRSRSCSSGAVSSRGRRSGRRNYRSPSSSTSRSRSSSRSRSHSHNRSRSHPRCHRASSRCGCRRHRGYGHRHRRSPTRRYRDRSPSMEKYSRRRSSTSRPRYSSHRRHRDTQVERTYRSRSRSMSSGRSVSLSVENKRDLLLAAKANAKKMLGVGEVPLPESVKPILPEEPELSDEESSVFERRVRRDSEKSLSQSGDERAPSPVTSPHRKTISFSINNSFAKPTVLSQSSVRAAVPADTYDSSKPYGLWVPVPSSRKHKQTKSH